MKIMPEDSTRLDSVSSALPYLFVSETQYFGFFPLSFVDRIINTVNELIYASAERFFTVLYSSEQVHSQVSPFQIEDGLSKMLTLMEASVDKHFDLFEMFVLKNIFKFPESLKRQSSDMQENDHELDLDDENIKALKYLWLRKRIQLKQAKILRSKLEKELQANQKLSDTSSRVILSPWVPFIGQNSSSTEGSPMQAISTIPAYLNTASEEFSKIRQSMHQVQDHTQKLDQLTCSTCPTKSLLEHSALRTTFPKYPGSTTTALLEKDWQNLQQIATLSDISLLKSSIMNK
jgi:hypothetical protein